MNIQKQLLQLKTLVTELEESERDILKEIIGNLEKHRKLEEPDEYVDFLLGLAAECEERQEQAIYDVVDYIQELECQ